jgi:predicted flap endonuclease-1-like 5' DNA nuclease
MFSGDETRPLDGSLRDVLGLSKSDVALLLDLGYGSFRSIADLTDTEIDRLSDAFDIPRETIRDGWIPDSRARAAREPRA